MQNHGQSVATIDKERRLGSAMFIGTKIANKKLPGRTYFSCDLNSGPGWNDKVNVPGTPLVFHNIADANLNSMRSEAFFIDKNPVAVRALLSKIKENPYWEERSSLFVGDNEEGLEVFAERIRQADRAEYATGHVIGDPDGYWYNTGLPSLILPKFSLEFPRIDIILNLNISFYWKARSHAWGKSIPSPAEVLKLLNKRFWIIAKTACGGNVFLVAVGRNVETGDHRALGLHRLESDEGRHIMTIMEGGRQGKLDLPELSRIPPTSDLFSGSCSGNEKSGR